MQIARFEIDGLVRYGIIEGTRLIEVQDDIFCDVVTTGAEYQLESVRLLPPCQPTKVIALGLNYAEHAAEAGKSVPSIPLIFLKAPSSVIGHNDVIVLPADAREVEFEAELAVVIKSPTRNIRPEEAHRHLLGYTCANDVSARDYQRQDGQWTRGKSCDTFCPLGPWIATHLPMDARIELYQNGQLRQSASTAQMIFGVPEIISFVARYMTLLPGDVILTGTPAGCGRLADGDIIEVRIEGIGSLINYVRQGAEPY